MKISAIYKDLICISTCLQKIKKCGNICLHGRCSAFYALDMYARPNILERHEENGRDDHSDSECHQDL